MIIKFQGLFKKLIIYQLILFIAITISLLLTISFFEKKFWKDYLIKDASSKIKLLNPIIMRTLSRGIGRIDEAQVIKDIEELVRDKADIKSVSVINESGSLLISYGAQPRTAFNQKNYKKHKDVLFRDEKIDDKYYLDMVIPFETVGRTLFYIRYLIQTAEVQYQIFSLNMSVIIIGFFYLLFAILLSYFYVKNIIVPLQTLTSKANLIKEGNLNQNIPVFQDEIGELSEAISAMIDALRKNQEELRLKNERLNKSIEEALYLQNQIINYEKFAALGKISAGMSHEIDNPLGIIIGHCEYLKSEMPEDSPLKEDIDTILREAKRIKNILRSMLDFAKPKESKIRNINITELVRGVIRDFSFQKIFKKISASVEGTDLWAMADEGKLHQSLVNIILNAIQAMPEGGRIYISLREQDGRAVISIKDEGVGIPEELLEKAFDIFFSTKKDGTGIGLAITKKFIEDMGGSITLSSEEGKGTEVTIYLPLAK